MRYKNYSGKISKEDAMDSEAIASFDNGYETVLLPAGFVLWRFVSRRFDRQYGAFWVDSNTMTSMMQVLHVSGIFSQSYKKDNVRNSIAVLDSWSNLSWRIKIKVNKEVIAYVGKTGPQKNYETCDNITGFGDEKKMERLMDSRKGGLIQYVIPRFKRMPNDNQWASVEHFAHI